MSNEKQKEVSVDDIVHDIKIVRKRCERLMSKIDKAQNVPKVKRLNAMAHVLEQYMQLLNNLTVDLASATLRDRGV